MIRVSLALFVFLAGCCSSRPAKNSIDVPQLAPPFLPAPPYPPTYMGAPFRGVGSDGYPIYRACGAGRCG